MEDGSWNVWALLMPAVYQLVPGSVIAKLWSLSPSVQQYWYAEKAPWVKATPKTNPTANEVETTSHRVPGSGDGCAD